MTAQFVNADEYGRQRMFADLADTAIYQPSQILNLVRIALDQPVAIPNDENRSPFRLGQAHVVEAIPSLLEATAYHPDWTRESVDILWNLAQKEKGGNPGHGSAKGVLKRLAAWNRHVPVRQNFAMLLQAIRLVKTPNALEGDFTPFDLSSTSS